MALTDLTRISTSGIATGSSLSGAILHSDAHFRGNQVGVNSAIFDSSERELNFKDNVKLTFGDATNGDLRLYHQAPDNYILSNSGTTYIRHLPNGGDIKINATNIHLTNHSNNQTLLKTITNGPVELYHAGNLKFQTTNHGVAVTGILTATGFSGPLSNASGISTFYDLRVTNNLTVEGSTTTLDTNLIGVDRVEVGANSNTIAGIAVTQSGTADLVRLYDGASQVVTIDDEGKVGLGTEIPGEALHLGDNKKIGLGYGTDLEIYHTGSHGYIKNTTNYTYYQSTQHHFKNAAGNQLQAVFQENNAVTLYYSGSPKLKTLSNGINVTGNVGIGSDIPEGHLIIHGGAENPGIKLKRNTGGGDIASITWGSDSANFARINYRDASPHGLQFYSGGTASSNLNMILRHDGNVGIGSDLPDAKLDVAGNIKVTGQVRVSDGTTSAPSVAAASDTNSGLYFAPPDALGLVVGGSRKLLANSSGITINNGDLAVNGGNLDVTGDIRHIDNTNTKIAFTSNQIDFQSAGSSRLKVSQHAIYVQTGLPLAFLASSGATPNIKSGGTNNQDLLFTTGSGNPTRLQISSSGISTFNAGSVNGIAYPLHLKQENNDADYDMGTGIKFHGGSSTEYYKWSAIVARGDNNGQGGYSNTQALTFYTYHGGLGGSTEKMRLASDGNLGINNTDPDQRLKISGNIEVNAYDSGSGSGGYYTSKGLIIGNAYDAGITGLTDDRNGIIWQERGLDLDFGTNNTLAMKMTYDGNIGIGTDTMDSSANLSITDTGSARIYMKSGNSSDCSIYFGAFDDAATGGIRYDHSDDSLRFMGYNNSEGFRITSTGNIQLEGGKIYGENNASNVLFLQSTSGNGNHSRIEIGASQSSDNGGIHFYTAGSSTATRHMTLKGTSGNLGIGIDNPTEKLTVKQDGLADNTYSFATTYKSGNNASGYTASGIQLTGTADNSNGDKHSTYINFNSRDPSLNGSHGASAFMVLSNPDSQGTYGTGQFDFYIRNGAPYAIPNDPQASSSYWMESLFRIQSSGVVKVPGELRVDRIIPASGLPSSTFGGVVQIKWTSNVDNSNYSSTSDVTMQTVNFTPLRTSSRVLIHVVYPSVRSYTTGNTRHRLNHHIKRDGTEIYNLGEVPQWRSANFGSSGVEITTNVSFTYIDHPNTTGTVAYTATWQSVDGHIWNTAGGQMVMIVAEISG